LNLIPWSIKFVLIWLIYPYSIMIINLINHLLEPISRVHCISSELQSLWLHHIHVNFSNHLWVRRHFRVWELAERLREVWIGLCSDRDLRLLELEFVLLIEILRSLYWSHSLIRLVVQSVTAVTCTFNRSPWPNIRLLH
jgi:hypothetical protein